MPSLFLFGQVLKILYIIIENLYNLHSKYLKFISYGQQTSAKFRAAGNK